ncbi:MAG TPA: hypothetical protein VHB01_09230 [Nitrosospira sp.]|nr:hypothetical protein [Nitrosospira sp.]
MPLVKYIGKIIKTDSIGRIGLRWEPGQVRSVTAEVAERLLPFSDSWAKADKPADDGNSDHPDGPIGLMTEETPAEEPIPVVDFHSMDKDALAEFAQRNYNQKLDRRQSKETLRQKVVALFSQHELDK